MNPHDADAPALPGWTFGRTAACCTPAAAARPEGSSRRRRIWELGPHAHCPLVGMCLPIGALRRLARKVLGGEPVVDDYELHSGIAHDCKQRNRIAEAVQRELDRRFMARLRQTAAAKTTEALAAWWQAQASSTDLPGACWATLTHARCSPELELQVLGQVHMLQHQVGMATRTDAARLDALIDDNAVLTRELAAARLRNTRQTAEHASRCDAWQAELVRLRGQCMAAQSQCAALADDLQALRDAVPELPERIALARRGDEQAERIVELQRALQRATVDAERRNAAETAAAAHDADPRVAVALPASEPHAPALADRAVLCVGGRTPSVPVYRRLVESCGGRFLHHDGGDEHSAAQLDATLAAADLVICQAGCVSHNAYWRVKDHCKRTGKRCVFVDTPSAAGLRRALADIGETP